MYTAYSLDVFFGFGLVQSNVPCQYPEDPSYFITQEKLYKSLSCPYTMKFANQPLNILNLLNL
jgi:hypothetical protein